MAMEAVTTDIQPADLSRIPPDLSESISLRAEWSLLAMERSLFGPIHMTGIAMPFHHLCIHVGPEVGRVGMRLEGQRGHEFFGSNLITAIEAGDDGECWWDRPMEMACFYFTDVCLGLVLGCDVRQGNLRMHTRVGVNAPQLRYLLGALHTDAEAGKPHGDLIGDSIFAAIAAEVVNIPAAWQRTRRSQGDEWRVGRALDYIHTNLRESMSLHEIASAACTSPFHLSRSFKQAVGMSPWQYVLRERARLAFSQMTEMEYTLPQIACMSGFDNYSSFDSAMRKQYGASPGKIRRSLTPAKHA